MDVITKHSSLQASQAQIQKTSTHTPFCHAKSSAWPAGKSHHQTALWSAPRRLDWTWLPAVAPTPALPDTTVPCLTRCCRSEGTRCSYMTTHQCSVFEGALKCERRNARPRLSFGRVCLSVSHSKQIECKMPSSQKENEIDKRQTKTLGGETTITLGATDMVEQYGHMSSFLLTCSC